MLLLNIYSYAQVENAATDAVIPEDVGIREFKDGDFYGLKDYGRKEIILPAEYSGIRLDSKGRYIVEHEQYKGLYHSRLKKMVIPVIYNELSVRELAWRSGEEGIDTAFVVTVVKNGRKGLLDPTGQPLLALEYSEIALSDDFAVTQKDNKAGIYFLDKTKKNIPLEYDEIRAARTSNMRYFIAKKNDRHTLFDDRGNLVVGDQKEIYTYRDPLTNQNTAIIRMVNAQGKHSAYDLKKKAYLLSAKYDGMGYYYRDDQFIVKQNGKFGLAGIGDKVLISLQYDTLAYLLSPKTVTRFKAAKKQRYALLTIQNKALTKFEYQDIETNGPVFTVKVDKGYSVIDSMGRRIARATYDHVGMFFNGQSRVVLNGMAGFINTQGIVISPINKPNHARGYKTLNDLFKGFVRAIKSENDSILMEFCRNVIPDENSNEFMTRIGFTEYLGFPSRSFADHWAGSYVKYLQDFQRYLKRNNELETLKFEGLPDGVPGYWQKQPSLLLWQLDEWSMLSSSNGKHLFAPGELICLDGYWKAFGYPKWSIK